MKFERIKYPLSLSGVRIREGKREYFQIIDANDVVSFLMPHDPRHSLECLADAKELVQNANRGKGPCGSS